MDGGQVDLVIKLADAFKASGPFFLTIALGVGCWWMTKKAFDVYKDRGGTAGMRLVLLGFAAAFFIGSMVLGWRAVDWWVDAQDVPFGRYATIVRVPNDIAVWSDAAPLYQLKLDSQRSPTHSLRLAFLFKSQCPDDDVLIVQMNREGMQKPDTFAISCKALDSRWQTRKTFDLDVDDKGTLVLKHITTPEAAPVKVQIIGDALAGGMPVIQSSTKRTYESISDPAQAREAAIVLQSPRAPPGAKLEALGRLQASVTVLKQAASSDALNGALAEPLYATLLDLQRHSDRQLSKKAHLLLAELPLVDDLARMSGSSAGRRQAMQIIDSMSAEDAAQTRQKAQAAGHAPLVAMLSSERTLKKSAPPMPTYTRDGDRFFVRANWNNADEKAVQCIGKAYHDHWGGASLQQQTDLVRGRTTRTVYYTKEWSREMLRLLQACGADASYVQGIAEAPEAPAKALR